MEFSSAPSAYSSVTVPLFSSSALVLICIAASSSTSKMSYSTATTAFTLFPASSASPNAFGIFTAPQSPRETYATYEDLRQVFRPSTGYEGRRRKNSGSSITSGFKKFFGA